jgi:hypothetical protein
MSVLFKLTEDIYVSVSTDLSGVTTYLMAVIAIGISYDLWLLWDVLHNE